MSTDSDDPRVLRGEISRLRAEKAALFRTLQRLRAEVIGLRVEKERLLQLISQNAAWWAVHPDSPQYQERHKEAK